MIRVKELSKSFGDIKALVDLSFEIEQGEIVGLLGPNGAGKTTTLRIMSGFYSPDKGDVFIDDVSVTKKPVLAQSVIGYLPENNPLYKDMLVSDMLAYSADLKGISKKDLPAALDFSVNAVNIKDVFNRPIGELSKGYKQRVGIAIALLNDPKILILDEPTEGLDPKQRIEIRELIKKLAKDHTVIISTHVLQEVEAFCSRIIIVSEGKKVADGTVKEFSQGTGDERIVFVEIEGRSVEKRLKIVKKVKVLETQKVEGDRVGVKLSTPLDFHVQPELSKLSQENKWVIWKLVEETRQLEDVFKEVTK